MKHPEVDRFRELRALPRNYSTCNQLLRLATKLASDPSISPSMYRSLLLDTPEVDSDVPKTVTLAEYRRWLALHCRLFFVADNPILPKDVMGEILKHVKFDYPRYKQLRRKLDQLPTRNLDPVPRKKVLIYENALMAELTLLSDELGIGDMEQTVTVANFYPLFDHPYIKPYAPCVVHLLLRNKYFFHRSIFGISLSELVPYQELIYRNVKNYLPSDSKEELIRRIRLSPLNDIEDPEDYRHLTIDQLNSYLRTLSTAEQLPETVRPGYLHSSEIELEVHEVPLDCLAAYQFFLIRNSPQLDQVKTLIFGSNY